MSASDPPGSITKLEDVLLLLAQQHLSLTTKIDELLHRLPPSQPSPSYSPFDSTNPPLRSPSPATTHKMKLDVPRFDGTDPNGWIFKINQFF